MKISLIISLFVSLVASTNFYMNLYSCANEVLQSVRDEFDRNLINLRILKQKNSQDFQTNEQLQFMSTKVEQTHATLLKIMQIETDLWNLFLNNRETNNSNNISSKLPTHHSDK